MPSDLEVGSNFENACKAKNTKCTENLNIVIAKGT